MKPKPKQEKKGFGTAPVFFTAISTILGAILFLRFGYAIGNVGFIGGLGIILISHMVTIPTALAVAEIATNQKVEGGGEYYIISRSFGITIGSAIGIALYFSQAISVAFYIIALTEAFQPVIEWIYYTFDILIPDKRFLSIPFTLGLIYLMLKKGADVGVKFLYIIVGILFVSLIMFFMGSTGYAAGNEELEMTDTAKSVDPFFYVFAIVFPAFTGMTAGVGLSGDLREPRKSIPLGTIAASLLGMVVYIFITYKLSISASPADLANDQFIMAKIAVWGPIIYIGLAASTMSSALGSIMVAPRTLQAIAKDKIFPSGYVNYWVSRGEKKNNEPVNATLVTAAVVLVFVAIGDVNFVAGIITMFFMLTYGSLCLISFLEHFAADPSYRPTFRSRWYISLFGAIMCIWLMFKINTPYAIGAIAIMFILYFFISYNRKEQKGMSNIFRGAIFQLSRQIQVFLQKAEKQKEEVHWRPSVICISRDSFDRRSAFDLLRYIAKRYGFGTYIHLIDGYLGKATNVEAETAQHRLIKAADNSHSNVYIYTLISPSFTSALAQTIQLPGVSGKENNMMLFEFSKKDPQFLNEIGDAYPLLQSVDFDTIVLGSSDKNFGYKNEIHIWIGENDYTNASLMILLGYVIFGHQDWENGKIKIFALHPAEEIEKERIKLIDLINTGRLPISINNVELIPHLFDQNKKDIINSKSKDADLTILGFRGEMLKHETTEVFSGYDAIGDVLFVNANKGIEIK
ncbi:MAG: solute carrier family 12 sodium/potassium/chloride transporter 2 [Sphingobacteriales bacterium]|jgi:solute carrier family 12 sodium/potassium/chloride transporter 2